MREKLQCLEARKGSHGLIGMKMLCFEVAVSFLESCTEVVSRICLRSSHLLCSCCVMHSHFSGFPDKAAYVSGFAERIFVLYFNNILILCSTTSDLSVCASAICPLYIQEI